MITFLFIAKLIIFFVYVNWALLFSIGLQCMCIEQVKTKTNLSCLNKKKLFSKVNKFAMCFYLSLDRIICLLFVIIWTVCQKKRENVQIIKRYIMTNIDTQETDYSVYYVICMNKHVGITLSVFLLVL